jgi:hypothetical protein
LVQYALLAACHINNQRLQDVEPAICLHPAFHFGTGFAHGSEGREFPGDFGRTNGTISCVSFCIVLVSFCAVVFLYRAGWFFVLLRRACGPMSRSMLAVEWNYNVTTVIRGKP